MLAKTSAAIANMSRAEMALQDQGYVQNLQRLDMKLISTLLSVFPLCHEDISGRSIDCMLLDIQRLSMQPGVHSCLTHTSIQIYERYFDSSRLGHVNVCPFSLAFLKADSSSFWSSLFIALERPWF